MTNMIKKIFLEFIAGCIFSIPGAGCLGGIYFVFLKMTKREFSRGAFAMILLLGIPMGILIGISVADRLLSKHWRINILGLVAGFILGLLGVMLGFYLLDNIGYVAFILIPLIAVFLSLFGYNFKFLFKGNI